MSVDRGPEDRTITDALNHYAARAAHFEALRLAAHAPPKFGVVLNGLHFVDIDPVAILDNAARTELRNPRPICAYQMDPTHHCVKEWHHTGDHLHI